MSGTTSTTVQAQSLEDDKLRKLVSEGKHVLLVEPGNSTQMAESIAKVFAEPDNTQRRVEQGKILVRTRFSPSARVEALAEVYKKLPGF
jgi:hypothetical protein